MSIVYLHNSVVFSYKKVLFFIGKIGVIKIKFPTSLVDISFHVSKSYIKILPLKLNKTNVKVVEDVSNRINKILVESNIGFSHKIILFGIGFRSWACKVDNGFKYLILKIGFSRDLSLKIPTGVKIIVLKPTLILFKSLDKDMLNQFVAFLRSLKTPDSYKGKGLRYVEEKVILKAGKT
jgi:large subunit ribosomal protein L6